MYINDKIKSIRKYRNLTQKELGDKCGFAPETARIRISQIETTNKAPSQKAIIMLAEALDIAPEVLTSTDFYHYTSLVHALYDLQENFNISVGENKNGDIVLTIPKSFKYPDNFEKLKKEAFIKQEASEEINNIGMAANMYGALFSSLKNWNEMDKKYRNGQITLDEYTDWKLKKPTMF